MLCEFRSRLVKGKAEALLFDRLLTLCREQGFLVQHGRQRTDSTHVLGAVRALNRLGCTIETLRAALNVLAAAAPDWRRPHADKAMTAPDAPSWLRQVPAIEVLRRVWVQTFCWINNEAALRRLPRPVSRVEGPSQLRPPPADNPWQARTDGAFTLDQFSLDWDRQIATCPAGKTSEGPRHHRGAEKRAGIEETLSKAVRVNGRRRSRYIGSAKTHLQQLLAAAAINLSRIADWIAENPLALTQQSAFIRLMTAPA